MLITGYVHEYARGSCASCEHNPTTHMTDPPCDTCFATKEKANWTPTILWPPEVPERFADGSGI